MNFDLFDGETKNPSRNMSIYQKIKGLNKYRKSMTKDKCKNCLNHKAYRYHDKLYHKCKLIGYSSGDATDIRAGHICNKYERETE